jgi:hypothetical protein
VLGRELAADDVQCQLTALHQLHLLGAEPRNAQLGQHPVGEQPGIVGQQPVR